MNIVFNLFLYTGILGSTICPEFQLGMNILYTCLSLCAVVVPFLFDKFYFTDNRYILCAYITTAYCVYASCVHYFRKKMDKLLFSNFEQECTPSQLSQIKITIGLFLTVGIYCLIGIPVSLYFTQGVSTVQVGLASLVGCYWLFFYTVCCTFYTYILMFCLGQTSILKNWLKGLKRGKYPTDKDSIYQLYNHNYKVSKAFRGLWERTMIITMSMIGFRIPFSFILLTYANVYWEAPLLLFYIIMFLQLSIAICGLNAVNDYFQIYFKKHPDIIQNKQDVDELIEYNKIRTLGISIYGFHPSFKHLLGMVLLVVNVAMPVGLSFLISSLK